MSLSELWRSFCECDLFSARVIMFCGQYCNKLDCVKETYGVSLQFKVWFHLCPVWLIGLNSLWPSDAIKFGQHWSSTDSTKPLHEPMLTNHQWCILAIYWKCSRHLSLRWVDYSCIPGMGVGALVLDMDAQHRLLTRNATKGQKGGQNYTFCKTYRDKKFHFCSNIGIETINIFQRPEKVGSNTQNGEAYGTLIMLIYGVPSPGAESPWDQGVISLAQIMTVSWHGNPYNWPIVGEDSQPKWLLTYFW